MKNLWKILAHEYRRHVLRRRFLIALISIPLWLLFSVGMGLLSVTLQLNNSPVGYVDQANFITSTRLPGGRSGLLGRLAFKAFTDEATARAALDAKKIQAYYVLPSDYNQTRSVRVVYREKPDSRANADFENLLRYNGLANLPAPVVNRIMVGSTLKLQTPHDPGEAQNPPWFRILLPIAVGVFLIVSVFTSSGYLMQAVVEEKENRTMEILATSASPEAIMGGKIIALILVGLTQILVWSAAPLVALVFARAYIPFLSSITLDWAQIGLMVLTALPTFVLIAALMASIGATATEAREGQQVSGLVTLLAMLPFMLVGAILANPNGIIAMVLSFFPLTASLTLLLRMAFTDVPLWQTLLSVSILLAASVGALWLAGRLFRVGMLRYGKRMDWKDILQAVGLRRAATNRPANRSGKAA